MMWKMMVEQVTLRALVVACVIVVEAEAHDYGVYQIQFAAEKVEGIRGQVWLVTWPHIEPT
jgi:hypothetical protein